LLDAGKDKVNAYVLVRRATGEYRVLESDHRRQDGSRLCQATGAQASIVQCLPENSLPEQFAEWSSQPI